ncbi:MAG: DUF1553 domain-containing protein, partial [Planctomycetia bacterium]
MAVAKSWTHFDPQSLSGGGATLNKLVDLSVFAGGPSPDVATYKLTSAPVAGPITGLRLEALLEGSLPSEGPGRGPKGAFLLSEIRITSASAADPAKATPVKIKRAVVDAPTAGSALEKTFDGKLDTGWTNALKPTEKNTAKTVVFEFATPVGGSEEQVLTVELDQRGGDRRTLGRFRLSTTAAPPPLHVVTTDVALILFTLPEKRNDLQNKTLEDAFLKSDPARAGLLAEIDALTKKEPKVVTSMVVAPRATPRVTNVHLRGEFLQPGAVVEPEAPAVLPPLETTASAGAKPRPNRLHLARWLVSNDHPLTARVTVNRVWQVYFGLGLVETENDFGT